MSPIYARASRVVTQVRADADATGWQRVTISCACATVVRAVPPGVLLADALELARAERRREAGPECPHNRGRP